MKLRIATIAALALLGAGCAAEEQKSAPTTAPTSTTAEPVDAEPADSEPSDDVSQGIGSQDASGDVADVQIVWGEDEYDLNEVSAKVTNNSEKRSDYSIDVAIESPDGSVRHDQAFLWVENLEPGQSTEIRSSFDDAPRDSVPVLKTVQRTAST